jgi:ribosome-associated heat shock protein Hsp15
MKETPHHPRLDKWLWAARFFKTRRLAKEAIEGGKVHYEGHRTKPGKLPHVGARVTVRQGYDEKDVIIRALADRRGPATEAQKLYEETPESIERRERMASERQMQRLADIQSERPEKKTERRRMEALKLYRPWGE